MAYDYHHGSPADGSSSSSALNPYHNVSEHGVAWNHPNAPTTTHGSYGHPNYFSTGPPSYGYNSPSSYEGYHYYNDRHYPGR